MESGYYIVAGTGHRPGKLGDGRGWLRGAGSEVLMQLHAKHGARLWGVSGMALGWDQDLAELFWLNGIHWTAAVPFDGQEALWPEAAQQHYRALLGKADNVVYVSQPGYSAEKMHARNRWMVDHADIMLAAYDGSPGGTRHCVNYALRHEKQITRLDPKTRIVTHDWRG